MSVTVEQEDPKSEEASGILRESHIFMQAMFSPDQNHFLSIDELCKDNIQLFVGRVDGLAAGTGALVANGDYGEVKSMFTRSDFRGQGVADAVLDRIVQEARKLNLPYLRLETGDLLHEAMRLYSRFDFYDRGPFGDYEDDGSSVFLEKKL